MSNLDHSKGLPLAWGLLAGGIALALDSALAVLTGDPVGWNAKVALVYLAAGALAAGVVALAARGFRRRPTRLEIGCLALALPYVFPLWERLGARLQVGVFAGSLALLATSLWLLLLHRLSKSLWAAGALTALTASAALAVNRNLLDAPLAPASLAADGAILLAAVALALVCARSGPRRTLASVAAILAVSSGGAWLLRHDAWGYGGAKDMPPAAAAPGDAPRPHVLLLTIDTLRLDVFQDVAATTPEGRAFVDALPGAVFFDRARAPSPWTAPSVATLMTGLLPDEHGYGVRTGDRDRPLAGLPTELPTLAEGLRAAGYRCEAYVANPLLFPGSGIDRGFDVYRALEDSGHKMPWMRALFVHRLVRRATRRWVPRIPYLPGERVADVVTRRIRILDDPPQPLFLWVHLMDPHAPYRHHPNLTARPKSRSGRYRGEVRHALRQATRIVRAYRQAGLWHESVVIFTSDHGEMFPSDGHREVWPARDGRVRRSGHGHSLHAEVVRVPLALRVPPAPGVPRESAELQTHEAVTLADLAPTLEDLLGLRLAMRRSSSARSLVRGPVVGAGEEAPPRTLTLAGTEWGPKQRGLLHGRWKLVHFPHGELEDRLYAVDRDPRETRDLAQADSDVLNDLRRRLEAAWAQMQEPTPADAGELDEETRQRLRALGYLDE